MISRDSQMAFAGELATLESMIEHGLIKTKYIPETLKRIEMVRQRITDKDILDSLEESKHPE